jgi:hypothetical protein
MRKQLLIFGGIFTAAVFTFSCGENKEVKKTQNNLKTVKTETPMEVCSNPKVKAYLGENVQITNAAKLNNGAYECIAKVPYKIWSGKEKYLYLHFYLTKDKEKLYLYKDIINFNKIYPEDVKKVPGNSWESLCSSSKFFYEIFGNKTYKYIKPVLVSKFTPMVGLCYVEAKNINSNQNNLVVYGGILVDKNKAYIKAFIRNNPGIDLTKLKKNSKLSLEYREQAALKSLKFDARSCLTWTLAQVLDNSSWREGTFTDISSYTKSCKAKYNPTTYTAECICQGKNVIEGWKCVALTGPKETEVKCYPPER